MMKSFFLATAALSLPAVSHAFIAAKSSPATTKKSTTLFQEQYYDADGNPVYYGEPQNYDQGQYDQNQQNYDQNQQGYAQDQQQQSYDQNQQQQQFIVQEEEEPSLFISDDMSGEMARATNGIEAGGIDYLALARQRAAYRVDSNNSQGSDSDWLNLAEQKRQERGQYADDEDWEKSLEDEGSLDDSAALGMGVKLEEAEGGVMMTEGGLVVDNIGEEGDEPQLLF